LNISCWGRSVDTVVSFNHAQSNTKVCETELLYKEMYTATYERHKALLEVPNVGESNSSAIKRRMIDTGSTAYREVKRQLFVGPTFKKN
jgi:hypothetical protein